ncbi:hypothetical protein MMC10_008259 [Thelotrema lepadinum]|nr:hypothetical protein [Thelotrema lepadinum]
MNQLEKKGRLSATISLPTNQLPPKEMNGPQDKATATVMKPPVVRSKTSPELALTAAPPQKGPKPGRNRSNVRDSRDRSSSPICRSPTWSLRGRDKTKRSEKEQREIKKQETNEEDGNASANQVSGRTRKRLSKRPPAAMETQGFAIGLGSPAQENVSGKSSRRNSFSESLNLRRSSISSFTSTLRFPDLLHRSSSSQPPTPVDGSSSQEFEAPHHKPQQTSKSSILTKYSSGDEAYVTDLVDFACEMGMSAQKALEADVVKARTVQEHRSVALSPGPEPSDSPIGAKVTSVDPKAQREAQEQATKRHSGSSSVKPALHPGKQDNGVGGYKYPNFKKLMRKQKAKTTNVYSPSPASRNIQDLRSQSLPSIPVAQAHGTTGTTSYVQQHRLDNEERSIARLEDELAVKKATDAIYNSPTELSRQKNSLPSSLKPGKAVKNDKKDVDAAPLATKKPNNQVLRNESERISQSPERLPKPVVANIVRARSEEKQMPSRAATEPVPDNAKQTSLEKTAAEARGGGKVDLQSRKSEQVQPTLDGKNTESISSQVADSFQLLPLQDFTTSPISQVFVIDDPIEASANDSGGRKAGSMQDSKNQKGSEMKHTIGGEEDTSEKAMVRRTSGRRPRSDPNLNVEKLDIPSLDFLPSSKHQSLVKPKQGSRVSFALPDDFQEKSSVKSLKSAPPTKASFDLPLPKFGRPPSSSSLTSTPELAGSPYTMPAGSISNKPTAKLFIICCKCERWHDLPSKIYEAVALPQSFFKNELSDGESGTDKRSLEGQTSKKKAMGRLEGKVFTAVKCPWCEHGMSTSCCAGWTAIVYMHERHH